MSRDTTSAILPALLAGAVAGALVAGVMSRGPEAEIRELQASIDEARGARDQAAQIQERLLQRIETLERHVAADAARAAADDAADALLDRFSQELASLRDELQNDLGRAEERLTRLEAWVAGARPGAGEGDSPELGDEALRELAILARDPDAGIRFSALSMLGRRRTDRAVQASCDCLTDDVDLVVWQALRNLGRFEERSQAAKVVPHLDAEAAVIRAAAYEALLAMGAPDTGFDPSAPAEKRDGAVGVLRKWALENQ